MDKRIIKNRLIIDIKIIISSTSLAGIAWIARNVLCTYGWAY